MKLLLSIKPEFALRIFAGEKTYEFRKAVHQQPGQRRGERRADGRASEEPDAAQHADDEPLPVAGDGEGGRKHNQDQVQQIAWHLPKV